VDLEVGGSRGFSVKSMYGKLEGLMVRVDNRTEDEKRVFRQIWKSRAPSKAADFSWKLLLDWIPTRINIQSS